MAQASPNRKVLTIHPLEVYDLNEADRGRASPPGIGPVYTAPLYLQRRHGIGNLFGSLFRWVRPLLWTWAKAVGRETLRTGGKILTDIAENKSHDVSAGDIVSKYVTESAQKLFGTLRGRGRKRPAATASKKKNKPAGAKRARVIKRDIFS
jgi:hypothetical protein